MEFIFFNMFYIASAILFFIVALSYNIKYAILSLICFNIFFFIIKKKSFSDNKALFNFSFLLIFGLLTFIFDNDNIIKFKTSVIYIILSFFLICVYFCKNNFFETILLKYNLFLDHVNVRRFILSLSGLYFFLSILNMYIVMTFSTKFWLFFKTFGFSFIFLVFILLFYLLGGFKNN